MALTVLGTGFGRTGTDSMREALNMLGFGRCHHMREVNNDPEQKRLWRAVAAGTALSWSELFAGYQSCVDWPSAHYWRQLIDVYPNAKVVLTYRSPESWWESFLTRMGDALTGSVCVVQRTDGALRLNVHLHVLALDSVYTEDASGVLTFHALPTPTAAEVSEIAERTAKRLHKALQKQGRVSPWDEAVDPADAALTDSLQDAQPGLFACYQAAAAGIAVSGERAGRPLLRRATSASSPVIPC